LFSAIVAAFIIEIYKTLTPTNGQKDAAGPSSMVVRVNIVLFFSFFLSIMSAVGCALIQQWCDEYKTFANPRAAPHVRGRVRTYLFQGLDQFQMRRFMYGIHVLLHISVFLFFWAISDFFYIVNHDFGTVTRCALIVSLVVYMLLSVSPLIFSNSPYNTPMTPPLRATCIILRIIFRFPWWCLQRIRGQQFKLIGLPYYKGIHFDRARLYSIEAEDRAEKLEPYAMEWLFTENDFSDNDMDKFLYGLPGYMSSSHTKQDRLDEYLTADYFLRRIKEHFITCATSEELSEEESLARVSSCVEALLLIFENSRERNKDTSMPDKLRFQKEFIQYLIDDFQIICDTENSTIALRASCIRGLAVHGLLSRLVSSDSEKNSQFPISLIPLYNFYLPSDNADTIQGPDEGREWMSKLRDVPLANLTMLAQAVRKREHAPPSILSFCWKTLDMLLAQLGTIHPKEPTRAQHTFDELHEDIRTYVRSQKMGFRMTPLLEFLDAIARGRRLLTVFSGHPKYHSRTDIVFGKEHLRNSDLLEAFAHCLPNFIASNSPEVCRDFLEDVVCRDDLWTSLQMNLWDTQRLDGVILDKLRIFEDCCTVLDLTFSVLEDSQKVDWRAPEFGSLSQQFESFIKRCFKGAFMGKTTSFRVGIIRARVWKATLAQFWNDIDRERVVSFRSQWDVASLARLICHLGLPDKDTKYWVSYVDGDHIGPEFNDKAPEMIHITKRDGPLHIFCYLGQLVASAAPHDQSGLEPKDVENALNLQQKLIENKRLSLGCASVTVWNRLDRLREHVVDLCGKNAGKDKGILECLLRMIEDVRNHRISGSEGPIQSEYGKKIFHMAYMSEPTAINGDHTNEDQTCFGRANSFINSQSFH